jgi:hypothetical protein
VAPAFINSGAIKAGVYTIVNAQTGTLWDLTKSIDVPGTAITGLFSIVILSSTLSRYV